MRFLVDECTGPAVASWLLARNHDVFSVFDKARGMEDEDIIRKVLDEKWILITNDKGFGEKVYRERRKHKGIILLRLEDERSPVKVAAVRRLLADYADRLIGHFIVVTETKVRIARM